MMELQQKIHDIARKGSDTPFGTYKRSRFGKGLVLQINRPKPARRSDAVQLSLFQNR